MNAPHVPLSLLDLVPISEGMTTKEAISASMEGAKAADRLGYERLWFAEHHNTNSLASSATSLLIDRAASMTERIRVGSGGIMLPNHAPLTVIEQFGTLVQFHGDRIDLGLGRAPGTDQLTAQLLARTSADPAAFVAAVEQMRDWSREESTGSLPITADVARGTEVPMWILGSTANGARLAAQLGMPFSVASHFAPFQYVHALDVYRQHFDPNAAAAQIEKPRTMVGVNLVVADTDEEAQRQFTTLQQMFLGVVTGQRKKIQPPRPIEEIAPEQLLAQVDQTLSIKAVGSPTTVVRQLEEIVAATGADELILTAYYYDPADRLHALELLAAAWACETTPPRRGSRRMVRAALPLRSGPHRLRRIRRIPPGAGRPMDSRRGQRALVPVRLPDDQLRAGGRAPAHAGNGLGAHADRRPVHGSARAGPDPRPGRLLVAGCGDAGPGGGRRAGHDRTVTSCRRIDRR